MGGKAMLRPAEYRPLAFRHPAVVAHGFFSVAVHHPAGQQDAEEQATAVEVHLIFLRPRLFVPTQPTQTLTHSSLPDPI